MFEILKNEKAIGSTNSVNNLIKNLDILKCCKNSALNIFKKLYLITL